jgi:O-antigen/teichoic acid export membrane protein
MLRYGVPLSISSILVGVLGQFYGFMMASYVSNYTIGNYQAAVNFSVLLSFLTAPIGTVLFPAFAKLNPESEHELLRTVFASSVKYAAILLVPATMAVMVLSTPLVNTIFGEQYASAPFLLTLYVIGNLFVAVGNLSLGSFLSGLGETKMLLKMSILNLTVGIPIAFLMIPTLGIVGVIFGLILSGVPNMIWGLHWVWKHYGARAEFGSSVKIFLASGIAAVATYLPTVFLNTVSWVKLIIGLTIFLALYVLGAPMIGAVRQAEIDNLRTMFSGLGIVSKTMNIPLNVAEKVAKIKCVEHYRDKTTH